MGFRLRFPKSKEPPASREKVGHSTGGTDYQCIQEWIIKMIPEKAGRVGGGYLSSALHIFRGEIKVLGPKW